MKGLIGKKVGMTHVFDDEGEQIPCTVVEAGPCVVTQVKNKEEDGYDAVQMGFGEAKKKNVPKALLGHFDKANTSPKHKLLEFRDFDLEVKRGQALKVDIFDDGDIVDVTGMTKGKGFQGVVKRHGFAGVGMQTHGQKDTERAGGSIGASADPSRVFKGVKMPGQMGNKRRTIKNLEIVKVVPPKNLMLIHGAVPGRKGTYLTIKKNS